MSVKFVTAEAKLEVLELLIERAKKEGAPTVAAVLSLICREIRLEAPEKRDEAIEAIEKHVAAVQRSRTALGYNTFQLEGLAFEVLSRWSLIKKALAAYNPKEE